MIAPIVEVKKFDVADVITTSGTPVNPNCPFQLPCTDD